MLPLVEFVLEDGITDEEAIQILDLSIPKQKNEEKKWQESRMGSILFTEFSEDIESRIQENTSTNRRPLS